MGTFIMAKNIFMLMLKCLNETGINEKPRSDVLRIMFGVATGCVNIQLKVVLLLVCIYITATGFKDLYFVAIAQMMSKKTKDLVASFFLFFNSLNCQAALI